MPRGTSLAPSAVKDKEGVTMNRLNGLCVLLLAAAATGCRDTERARAEPAQEQPGVATALASGSDRLAREELERDRLNMDWREWVPRQEDGDTTAAGPSAAASESWEQITPEAVNRGPVALPVHGDVSGPSVLRVQVLLDRVLFSPGAIDGRWGRNTEKAVHWYQEREGLRATGRVDEATWQRLTQQASGVTELVRAHVLTEDDVSGPFIDLPDDPYERRNLDCQCYESLPEKLAERFHTTEDLLAQLNPGVQLAGVRAGQRLWVPAVDRSSVPVQGQVAKLVVSDGGRYLHALDAQGRILYHFPATLGADYSPSPTGEYRITGIAQDPTWHYQPALLHGVDDDKPDAVLPPGPNNAVGTVWMQLSRPHYGIHGTSAPETIGYATSNGCVRLTNWDVEFLSGRVEQGVSVQFRDVRGGNARQH
jgi:lipoprotein-anchoring transpeptidase ErfK/SrfK